MPILHCSGVIIPGQFGPIKRDFDFISFSFTLIMSKTGIPSVIQTINGILFSIASIIAVAANLAGTYIIVAFALVFLTASSTVLKTGFPRCTCPPFFGVTPPTKLVP